MESRKKASFSPWAYSLRNGTIFAAWVALTISFFHPAVHLLDGGLAPSIFTAYAYFIAHGFQFTPVSKPDHLMRYVHAPSEVTWNLKGGEREINFYDGLDPRTYKEGTTNGVEFIVDIIGPSGGTRRIFSRMLKPLTAPADRGEQEANVSLPLFSAGSKLVLRTDPGEYNDTAWDWSYATRIKIKQGKYSPNLFPGFNRTPDDAEDEFAGVAELEHEKVLVLHVPGIATFNLAGSEKSFSFDFGFLPNAYSDGGRTDGAIYTVDLLRPNRPPQRLFSRSLKPLTITTDRGRQSAKVVLPATERGDKLVLRTSTVESGTNSWGWTFVERLSLE